MRLPAAIIHPDDALPTTWRLAERWNYRGQQGAWLVRAQAGEPCQVDDRGPGRPTYQLHDADAVQIVYRSTAPRRRAAHIGNALGRALEYGYVCSLGFCQSTPYSIAGPVPADLIGYYAGQGLDPAPIVNGYHAARQAAQAAQKAAAPTVAPRTGTVTAPTPEAPPAPLSSPPVPGLDRARWLGAQITAMMPRTHYLGWSVLARRRVAARVALAKVAGYETAASDNDALVLLAPASLQLQYLNEYAGRVFSGQEDSDAVL
jgi:hypothetical protein